MIPRRYSDVTDRSICPAGPKLLSTGSTTGNPLILRLVGRPERGSKPKHDFPLSFMKRIRTAGMHYTGPCLSLVFILSLSLMMQLVFVPHVSRKLCDTFQNSTAELHS